MTNLDPNAFSPAELSEIGSLESRLKQLEESHSQLQSSLQTLQDSHASTNQSFLAMLDHFGIRPW